MDRTKHNPDYAGYGVMDRTKHNPDYLRDESHYGIFTYLVFTNPTPQLSASPRATGVCKFYRFSFLQIICLQ
jgi:hypothetical protein